MGVLKLSPDREVEVRQRERVECVLGLCENQPGILGSLDLQSVALDQPGGPASPSSLLEIQNLRF